MQTDSSAIFWVMTPYKIVYRYQRFTETVSPSLGLKMEIVCFSEIFVSVYKSIGFHNPDE